MLCLIILGVAILSIVVILLTMGLLIGLPLLDIGAAVIIILIVIKIYEAIKTKIKK